MTGRATPEWIGRTPDAKVPDHVRLRIFRNADGLCHISGRKIAFGEKWELEHVRALADGGGHSESNLRPALVQFHKDKTSREATRRASADRAAKSALGIKSTSVPIPSRARESTRKPARIEKQPLAPRRERLFVKVKA